MLIKKKHVVHGRRRYGDESRGIQKMSKRSLNKEWRQSLTVHSKPTSTKGGRPSKKNKGNFVFGLSSLVFGAADKLGLGVF